MLRERLAESLKVAMKAKDKRTLSTVRLILAAIKDREITARGAGSGDSVGDGDILKLLGTMIRQRRDSIKLYEQGGRPDLAAQEGEEIAIIETFMPRQMADAEVAAAIALAVDETAAGGVKDMGKVMAWLREKHAGQMDFAKAAAVVKQRLT